MLHINVTGLIIVILVLGLKDEQHWLQPQQWVADVAYILEMLSHFWALNMNWLWLSCIHAMNPVKAHDVCSDLQASGR